MNMTPMPARSLAEITEFIAKFVGVPAERLSASTTLFGDLGVDGQDGSDLLVAFGQRFSVDLSSVDLRRHFGNEWLWPWAPFCWVVLWMRTGTPEQKARLSPITIADLVRAAESGRWSYPQ
jgi:acyl carrier protein